MITPQSFELSVRPERPRVGGYRGLRYTDPDNLVLHYSVDLLYGTRLEVVGDPDNGGYEWGVRDPSPLRGYPNGYIARHSDMGYCMSTYALQDGLNANFEGGAK
jgi:hypothetical protein